VLAQTFPAPGETLSVKTFSASKNGEMDVYNLTRPADEYLTAYVSKRLGRGERRGERRERRETPHFGYF
jgi:hypothetical protein